MRIHALHDLAVDHRLQTEHTVGTGVLRTDVDHIVVRTEQAVLLRLKHAAVVDIILQSVVWLHVVLKRIFA